MIKGVIFDLDGTILDSMFVWDTIGEDYLRFIGKEPKENLKETFKTFSLEQAANYYIENYQVALSVNEIVDGVNKIVEQYYVESLQLKSGVKEFLKNLKSYGVKMCIATVTDRHLVEVALKRLGVIEYFSEIFTCASVGHSKEEPHIYREAQKYLGTSKKATVVFEDALYAIKTAKTDGFITVGVFDEHEETIERLFGTAKEHHGFRYTQMIGKAKMEMKVSLTFACLNLKKLANMLDMRDKNPRIKAIFCKIMANIEKIFELSSKKAECSV